MSDITVCVRIYTAEARINPSAHLYYLLLMENGPNTIGHQMSKNAWNLANIPSPLLYPMFT